MNERIFKLALEAMDFHGAIDTDTHLKMNNSDIKKFGELIVWECYDLVDYENKQFIKAQFKEVFEVK